MSTEEKNPKTNGTQDTKEKKVADDNEDTNVFNKKFKDEANGKKMTSVKPGKTFEDARRTEKDTELVSGRKAGQRWHSSGIRFAPLNVPIQRRLQTLAVLFHTLCIALSVSTFFFLCAIPLFWPLLIPYMIYCMASKASTNGMLSHRSDFLRGLPFWSLFASYFPARLHRTQELPPTRKYIFGYHPHGIISHGAFAAFGTEALGFSQLFPGIRNTLLTLDSNFRIPIYRDYALAMGLASVSKESCENLLSKGGPNKVCPKPCSSYHSCAD
jgi:2-acylglycerol O-acyltransferase 2